MIDKKLAAFAALLLTTASLTACGSDGGSTDSTATGPPGDKQAQEPKPQAEPKPKADAGNRKGKPETPMPIDRKPAKVPQQADSRPQKAGSTEPRSNADGADASQPGPCAVDPDSRECEDSLAPEQSPNKDGTPPMHGDEPAAQSSCKPSEGGCEPSQNAHP